MSLTASSPTTNLTSTENSGSGSAAPLALVAAEADHSHEGLEEDPEEESHATSSISDISRALSRVMSSPAASVRQKRETAQRARDFAQAEILAVDLDDDLATDDIDEFDAVVMMWLGAL